MKKNPISKPLGCKVKKIQFYIKRSINDLKRRVGSVHGGTKCLKCEMCNYMQWIMNLYKKF